MKQSLEIIDEWTSPEEVCSVLEDLPDDTCILLVSNTNRIEISPEMSKKIVERMLMASISMKEVF